MRANSKTESLEDTEPLPNPGTGSLAVIIQIDSSVEIDKEHAPEDTVDCCKMLVEGKARAESSDLCFIPSSQWQVLL